MHNESNAVNYSRDDKRVVESGKAILGIHEEFQNQDGDIREFLTSKIPLYNTNREFFAVVGVITDVTEENKIRRDEREHEQVFKAMFYKNKAIKLLINPDEGRIIDCNEAACLFYGYSKDELCSKYISHINTLSPTEIKTEMDLATEEKRLHFNFKHRIASGEIRDVEVYSGPVHYRNQVLLHSIVFDVTERKKAEKHIKELLEQKEQILKEVHHRVKNNLNTVFNLLMLQSESVESEKAQQILADAASRTHSMMILYDKLYRSENFRTIDVKEFITDVSNDLYQLFKPIVNINLELKLDSISLHSRQLNALGILVNELFTNSIKYAFKGIQEPKISIECTRNQSNEIEFVYSDNGVGLPESINLTESSGFGMQLISMLINQLHGKAQLTSENGMQLRFAFQIIP